MFNILINTFRETYRNKIVYLILFFAGLILSFSLFIGNLTMQSEGEAGKVIVDFGLAMIEILGIISTIFLGSQLLFKEIEGKTIFLIFSKPIGRWEFIVGKYLGFLLCLGMIMFLMGILFLGFLVYMGVGIDSIIISSIFFSFVKMAILLSIVFLFSSFMSNLMAIISSFGLYLLAHSYNLISQIGINSKNVFAEYLIKGFQVVVPPLEVINTKDLYMFSPGINSSFFFTNTLHSILYIFVVIFLTVIIFNRKSYE